MTPAPARVDELKKRYEENPRRFFAPLANEYRKAGDLEAAIDLCRMHLEEQPGHLSGHIVYGQALYESSRAADAKRAFEAALTLDPENLIALRHLGDISKSEGDATGATHWYQRVLDADPRNDEVIALIDALKAVPPPPTVVISEEPELPPPPPQYAVDAVPPTTGAPVDPHAPTPVIPFVAVPAPQVRPSIGLMDLDLMLSDATAPSVDLLGSVSSPDLPPAEAAPPTVEAPAPDFEEGFPLSDSLLPAAAEAGPELLGADDTNLGLAGADEPIQVEDTSFDVQLPATDESTFALPTAESMFGDALDVTAGDAFELEAPAPGPLQDLPMIDMGEAGPIVEPITAVSALSAEPAAPTPGDFDLLFGNTQIGDVQVGGESAAAEVAETSGFIADSFIGREPTDETLELAPELTAPPSPFVTETMAELYLQQGFRDEALAVYRQLLAQNPNDAGLADRVRNLELGGRSSLAIDHVTEGVQAAAEAEAPAFEPALEAAAEAEALAFETLPEPAAEPQAPAFEVSIEPAAAEPPALELPVFDEPVAELPATPVVFEEVPVAYEEAPVPEAVVAFAGAPVEQEPVGGAELPELPGAPVVDESPAVETAVPAPASAPKGPTARSILNRIAYRRATPGGGYEAPAPAAPPVVTADVFDVVAPPVNEASFHEAAPEPVAALPVSSGGALDTLFANGAIGSSDEGAAVAMAAAFGGAPVTPIKGEPTRAGTGELSLDSVFGSDLPATPKPGVQRQSTKLRFDQFFAGVDESPAQSAASAPIPGKSEEDIAQFNDWLKGLKGQ